MRWQQLSPTVLEAVRGVDVLIHDAQYSRDELRHGKQGWGHSAWENVVQLALEAQVKQLYLFHHDPAATDEHLNERQFLAQQRFPHTFVAPAGVSADATRRAGRPSPALQCEEPTIRARSTPHTAARCLSSIPPGHPHHCLPIRALRRWDKVSCTSVHTRPAHAMPNDRP